MDHFFQSGRQSRNMAISLGGYQQKLLLIFIVLILPLCNGQSPIVDTPAGRVRGSVISGVSFFSAIPYGAPPIGNLRFEIPQKTAPWQGVFDATKQGNACIQFFRFPSESRFPPESEDCLSLDVYVPRDLSSSGSRPLNLLPVLVYVHGGGFASGSRRDVNATIMAKREDIIVVTINYRLGPFGFLALDDNNIPGNIGLHDQRLALQWIKENIKAFGGSPNKVVIFGKSAGAHSASIHAQSSMSKGLISGAIMSSGMFTEILKTRAQASQATTKIAATLGCDISSPRTILSCFCNQDVQSLVTAYTGLTSRSRVFVDGQFITKQPPDILKCGQFNHVPVIAGFNSDSGQAMVNYFGSHFIDSGILQNQIDDLIREIVDFTYPAQTEDQKLIAGNLAKAFYFNGDTSDHLVNLRSALDFARDIYWSAPVVKFAKYFSKAGAPVYLFEFDEKLQSDPRNLSPPIPVGADISHDLSFVWGSIEDARHFHQDNTPEKIQFSKDLSAAWASFVRNGKPSLKTIQGQQLDWKAYTEDDPSYAFLKADVTSIKKGPSSRADLVWNKVMEAVEDRKPKCPTSTSLPSTVQPSWFWMYNWSPRGSWWGWWMS